MDIVELNKPMQDTLLDIRGVFPRGEVNRLAICEKCMFRRDAYKNPFLKFVFRDVNGRRITGRQFDIQDVENITSTIRAMQNSIVLIIGRISYFNQRYIQVERCEVTKATASEQLKSKFFVHNIPEYARELSTFNNQLNSILSEDLKELFNVLSVSYVLENSFDPDMCDGLKGSSIMLVNTFNNSLAQITGKQGKLLMSANMLMESILVKASYDPAATLIEFSVVQNTILESITVERRKLLDIVKSAIYLYFKFEQDMYNSDAFLVNTVREFCRKATNQKEYFMDNNGVFLYEGFTVSRGEI